MVYVRQLQRSRYPNILKPGLSRAKPLTDTRPRLCNDFVGTIARSYFPARARGVRLTLCVTGDKSCSILVAGDWYCALLHSTYKRVRTEGR